MVQWLLCFSLLQWLQLCVIFLNLFFLLFLHFCFCFVLFWDAKKQAVQSSNRGAKRIKKKSSLAELVTILFVVAPCTVMLK